MRIITSFEEGDATAVFICRDGQRKYKKKIQMSPFLIILTKDSDHPLFTECKRLITETISEGIFTRLYTEKISGCRFLEKKCKEHKIATFESDVRFPKRVMLEKNMRMGEEKLRWLFYDIETDDSEKKIEIGKARILCIAAYDLEGNSYFFLEEDEKLLLERFLTVAYTYDVWTGWNSEQFDQPYIEARIQLHKIPFERRYFQCIDYMFLVSNGEFMSLEKASQKHLGMGKIERHDERIIDLFRYNRKKLEEYNRRDVELMILLEKKLNVAGLRDTLSSVANVCVEDVWYPTQIVDSMILHKKRDLKLPLYFPTREEKERGEYEGGYVKEPTPGIHTWVAVIDFISLYNRVICTFNISPETVGGKDITVPGMDITFSKKTGLIPHILVELEALRNSYKRQMLQAEDGSDEYKTFKILQNAVKVVLLSHYGVLANPKSRYYNQDMAEAITTCARFLIKETTKKVQAIPGCEVTYCDTDSAFVKLPVSTKEQAIQQGKDMVDMLNAFYPELLIPFGVTKENCKIQIKFEKLYKNIFFVHKDGKGVKKKYAARQIWEEGKDVNKLSITGFEFVRTDWNMIARELQKNIIEMILRGESPMECYKEIRKIQERVLGMKLTKEEVTITKTLRNEIENYVVTSPQIEVAKILRERGEELYVGKKIDFFYDEKGNPAPIIEFKGIYDTKKYWEEKIYAPTKRIVESLFMGIDWEMNGKMTHVKTLSEY